MLPVVAFVVSALGSAFFAGLFISRDREDPFGYLSAALSILVCWTLVTMVVPEELSGGYPKISISAGEYKVASVYVAGENVNIIVEVKNGDIERALFYRFPVLAFDGGQVNQNAKKLIVTESGKFKKLKLE